MTTSQVEGAARSAGVTLESTSGNAAGELAKELSPKLVIIDLSTPCKDLAGLVDIARASGARVVAFGPHVQERKLQAAAEAGCDRVMSRGQFFKQATVLMSESSGE